MSLEGSQPPVQTLDNEMEVLVCRPSSRFTSVLCEAELSFGRGLWS